MSISRKVNPGEIRQIKAAEWNGMLSLLSQSRQGQSGALIPSAGGGPWDNNTIIRVRNESGVAVPQWGVLGIGEPILTPARNLEEFQRLGMKGQTPNQSHRGRFVVLLEPLAPNAIGDAVAVGVVPVRIKHPQAEPPRVADIVVGECGHLIQSTTGVPVIYAAPPDETGMRWAVVNLSPGVAAPPAEINPCCGCPPTKCDKELESRRPLSMTVDFGDLLCCDGRAGGVKNLRWNGSAWASPMFWCDPDGGGEGECGTAVYRWVDAEDCGSVTYTYGCQTVQQPGGGTATFCEWGNPVGDCGTQGGIPFPPNPQPGYTFAVPCICPDGASSGWTLVSSSCNCGQSPVPPDRDGAYDGEEVTVICPGTPDDPSDPLPCADGFLQTVLWSGSNLADAGAIHQSPGTITWNYGLARVGSCLAPHYAIISNNCEFPETAQQAEPAVDVDWGSLPPGRSGSPQYIITACPDELCPPPGKVKARWVLVPPTGYAGAKLELRVAGVVTLRYVMPANRSFCEACLNRMEIEVSGCVFPCPNIPEFVCVRPGYGDGGRANCLPLASSYSFSVPTMTVANPSWSQISPGDLSMAAGSYVLDLLNAAGMDSRYEANGCRTLTPFCCSWRAPYSGNPTGEAACPGQSALGWVLQTCDPQIRTGLTAKRFQNYTCGDSDVPVLRFGLYQYRGDYVEAFGFTGPAVIEWTKFGGLGFDINHPGGGGGCFPNCCTPPGVCPDVGGAVWHPERVAEQYYALTWLLHERLEDGTLVMKMPDVQYTDWITAFPQTIHLSPE